MKHKVKIQVPVEKRGLWGKKKIVLDDAIKAPGTYNVQIKLHPQVTGTLSVKVTEA